PPAGRRIKRRRARLGLERDRIFEHLFSALGRRGLTVTRPGLGCLADRGARGERRSGKAQRDQRLQKVTWPHGGMVPPTSRAVSTTGRNSTISPRNLPRASDGP